MKIEFVNLKKQYLEIKPEVNKGIQEVIDTTSFILGKSVEQFEQEFATYCDSKYCVGVGTGLDALKLALKVCGVRENDEVILPANTFIATALAVSDIGARPVLVDMDEKNYNIDVTKIEDKITKKTKAILPVHLYGQPADMDAINSIAKKHNLIVVEDACQAHGSTYKGRKSGSLSAVGCFSFYPGKNLGCYGDGGAMTTNDENLYKILKMMRNYGQEKKYYHLIKGINSRLDSIQASVLRVKLKRLDEYNKKRSENANYYGRLLGNLKGITIPFEEEYSKHIFHLYVIRIKKRDELLKYLADNDISAGIHYPVPIHLQEAYADLGYKMGDFPVSEKAAGEIISLPMYPELTKEEIEFVVDRIRKFVNL